MHGCYLVAQVCLRGVFCFYACNHATVDPYGVWAPHMHMGQAMQYVYRKPIQVTWYSWWAIRYAYGKYTHMGQNISHCYHDMHIDMHITHHNMIALCKHVCELFSMHYLHVYERCRIANLLCNSEFISYLNEWEDYMWMNKAAKSEHHYST